MLVKSIINMLAVRAGMFCFINNFKRFDRGFHVITFYEFVAISANTITKDQHNRNICQRVLKFVMYSNWCAANPNLSLF